MMATITHHQCFYYCQVLSFIKNSLFIIPFFLLKSVATYIHTYILHCTAPPWGLFRQRRSLFKTDVPNNFEGITI